VLVDGYHRWQAHVREGAQRIAVDDLGDLTDAEIRRESIRRNASHGQQLSRDDKKRLAGALWRDYADFKPAERVDEIKALLAVSRDAVERWTKDARADEKREQQERAFDLFLDCCSDVEIGKAIGVTDKTAKALYSEIAASAEFSEPPESRQHFDVWAFPTTDRDAGGQQSYFGAVPPQVMENLLWFFTEPGHTVIDVFAGSGTTVDVAKRMGRRVWASDIRGNHYSPHLPIHTHDAVDGWPDDAPKKADLVFLDPPYWQQAAGQYSNEPNELAELDIYAFRKAWDQIVKTVIEHTGRVAYIISPTQMDDGTVLDHAAEMLSPFFESGWSVERRIIVPYSTQQATGQQVTWARENRRLLKLYRDLVVLSP
jgi:hypothetical protein